MANVKREINILVVDDDEIDIMFVERELSKLNLPINFLIAHDGVEAMNKLVGTNDEKPIENLKLIILDLMMPKMNGLEFLKVFRTYNQFANINIFVLTTSNNERDKLATAEYKVDGYFVKDTQFHEFIYKCKNVLELICFPN